MVVVVGERSDDPGRAAQVQVRAHEDLLRAGFDEAVDELLREFAIDLGDASGARSRRSRRG